MKPRRPDPRRQDLQILGRVGASQPLAVRVAWTIGAGALLAGLVAWGTQTLQGGVIALWAFVVAGVILAFVLPLTYALTLPLFIGVAGWLVNMMPFVLLVTWAAVIVRWAVALLRERRLPAGGRWIWLPVALAAWTTTGLLVIGRLDLLHFILLLGIQGLISGTLLLVVDRFRDLESRTQVSAGLVSFVIVLSLGVLLQWFGVPIQPLQNDEVRFRVEEAYGVDAFPNNLGMIKYARSVKPGVTELDQKLKRLRSRLPELPPFQVIRPKFQAYENSLLVQFYGSARAHENDLARVGVSLLFDDVGRADANTVPRMRSFPRNALTYAGVSAALVPFALYLAWAGAGRRRWLGRAGVAAALFGVGFSLARGAWVAVLLGVIYLAIDGRVDGRRKLEFAAAYLVAALVLAGVFFVKYNVDPVTGRAGGGSSVNTREDLYRDTVGSLSGKHILFGYGTAQPRTETGTVREGEGQRYVPRAGTHSTYLNYLFRLGVPGLLMIAGVYLLSWLHARAAARAKEGAERVFATCAATAVVIAGAHAVILSLYVEPIYTLSVSVMLGLAVAAAAGSDVSLLPWKRRAT